MSFLFFSHYKVKPELILMKKKPDQYTKVEDFLQDIRFIRWVTHPTSELTEFWSDWQKRFPERKDQFQQSKVLLESMKFKSLLPREGQADYLFEKIKEGRYSAYHQKSKRRLFKLGTGANVKVLRQMAATLLALVTLGSLAWYFGNESEFFKSGQSELITVVTKAGEKRQVTLPDGSTVFMNSESQLTYPSKFYKKRNISIEGEAFFKVAKNPEKPFIVQSKQLSTTALGTSFNVKAYGEDTQVSVALKTGKVVINNEVSSGWDAVYLVPGEKLLATNNKVEKTQLSNDDFSWKDGVLVLNNMGVKDFIVTIERWYGVRVQVNGSPGEDWMINGRFKNKLLPVVLESVSFAENINYTIQADVVELNFK